MRDIYSLMSKIIYKRTRFAPSPTGWLHLGHVYSALTAWHAAGKQSSLFCLRIDDLDIYRCKDIYTKQIIDDLRWLGIGWAQAPLVQSQRMPIYREALARLKALDVVYPCMLSRKQAEDLLTAPHESHHEHKGGLRPHPSTRHLQNLVQDVAGDMTGRAPVWRLDSCKADRITKNLYWLRYDGERCPVRPQDFGDVVVARRDIATSYHLSTVLDDAESGIELVVRGADLEAVTPIHRLLQALLDLPSPLYFHHPLITDAQGKRLAKRDEGRALKNMRAEGMEIGDILVQLPKIHEFCIFDEKKRGFDKKTGGDRGKKRGHGVC